MRSTRCDCSNYEQRKKTTLVTASYCLVGHSPGRPFSALPVKGQYSLYSKSIIRLKWVVIEMVWMWTRPHTDLWDPRGFWPAVQHADISRPNQPYKAFTRRPLATTHCAYPRRDDQAELTWMTGYIPRWFTRPQTVNHPSTNPAAHGRQSNSQLVDHKSDAHVTELTEAINERTFVHEMVQIRENWTSQNYYWCT